MLTLLTLLAQAPPGPDGGDSGAPFLVGGACVLVWIVLALASLIFWVWALVDAIQNPGLSSNERLLWVLVIILTQVLGAILYLLIGRKRGART
jgi:hypothetical protein